MNKIEIHRDYDSNNEENSIFILITDTGLHYLINNCPQIKSVEFLSRTNITNITIDQLIALALRNPRIQYDFYFSKLEKELYLV